MYRKLLSFVLSLSLIPMLVTGFFSYYSFEKSLKNEILKKLEIIADLKVKKIESFFKERAGDAFVISKSIYLQNYFALITRYFYENNQIFFQQTREILDHQLGYYSEAYGYRDIMFVDQNGIVVYTTNLAHFKIEYGKHIPAMFEDVFEKSKTIISFSNVYRAPVSPQSFLMIVAAPVRNSQGMFIGEVFFEIDMKVVYNLVEDKTGLGKTGETLLGKKIDEGALFLNPIYHDPDAALKRIAKKGSGLPILKAVHGEIGSGIAFDYYGDEVIAAWRPIPMLNWGMVAKIDTEEAFETVYGMRNRILILLVISTFIVSYFIMQITRSIANPIVELTKTTKLLKEGDLSARAKVMSSDEIGELAKNFNDMVEKLTSISVSLKDAQRIAHIGNWEMDLQTHELNWSDELFKIFEFQKTIIPSNEIFLKQVHEDDKEFVKIIHTDSSILQTPYNIQYRLLFQDNRAKYVEEQCETIFKGGKPVRTIGIIHDITLQREAEHEILMLNRDLENRVVQRTQQLETANKELEAFSYSVSHDLRAPLRSITGFAELLKNKNIDNLDEKSQHYLNVISESTVQMGRLIDDILSFSRMSRTELMETKIDFSVLIQNVIKKLDNEVKDRKIIWKINPVPNSTGDMSMMELAMTNLISNAVKFTKNCPVAEIEIGSLNFGENSITGSVDHKLDNDKEITYYIKDNGVGFDMNYAGKLFGLFQRLHRQDEFPGTGVGLANVQRIIKRHGGRIWAESKPGAGTIFYFTLPNHQEGDG
ncbi:MAG: ATP-binding protein [Spirochaetia bacterium]|nr:ATP-binding protein [Spirochaetia bacterium]